MNKIVTVILISVFILFSVVLGAMGAGIYEISADSNAERAINEASAYFTKTIKECEDTSALRTASIEGQIPALVLNAGSETGFEEVWYFAYNGEFKKIYSNKGDVISAQEGTKIMNLKSCDFILLTENLLEITFVTENGHETSMNIYLPEREGGAQ